LFVAEFLARLSSSIASESVLCRVMRLVCLYYFTRAVVVWGVKHFSQWSIRPRQEQHSAAGLFSACPNARSMAAHKWKFAQYIRKQQWPHVRHYNVWRYVVLEGTTQTKWPFLNGTEQIVDIATQREQSDVPYQSDSNLVDVGASQARTLFGTRP